MTGTTSMESSPQTDEQVIEIAGANILTPFDLTPADLRPMTDEESKTEIFFASNPLLDQAPLLEYTVDHFCSLVDAKEDEIPFLLKVMLKRLELSEQSGLVQITPQALMWTASLCKLPGAAIMWTLGMFHESVRRSRSEEGPLSLAAMRTTTFAQGIPTEEAMQRLWEGQKIKLDNHGGQAMIINFVDTRDAWEVGRPE